MIVKFLIAIFVLNLYQCVPRGSGTSNAVHNVANTATPTPEPKKPEELPLSGQPIVRIDFFNFSYHWCSNVNKTVKMIKVNNGKALISRKQLGGRKEQVEYSIANVFYNDFTNDGRADALVTVSSFFDRQGAACSYLYTLERDKPKLIWSYLNGDGFTKSSRRMNAYGNDLIVEEYDYGSGRKESGQAKSTFFMKLLFHWDGRTFSLIKSEKLPNDHDSDVSFGLPKNVGLYEPTN